MQYVYICIIIIIINITKIKILSQSIRAIIINIRLALTDVCLWVCPIAVGNRHKGVGHIAVGAGVVAGKAGPEGDNMNTAEWADPQEGGYPRTGNYWWAGYMGVVLVGRVCGVPEGNEAQACLHPYCSKTGWGLVAGSCKMAVGDCWLGTTKLEQIAV